MREYPLLERAGLPSDQFAHGWMDLRIVVGAIRKEAKEGIDIFGWHGATHLRPGLRVRLPFEAQIPPQDRRQHADLVSGQERFWTGQPIAVAFVPLRRQHLSRNRRDVGGVDGRDPDAALRGSHNVTGTELRYPLQGVR